jgi:Histidine kinase-like ATPase domain
VIAVVTGRPAISEEARSATLRVPAATDALSLVRLFATAIGRHVDLPPEVVEDLKLALTEVCSAAIEGARLDEDLVTVSVSWPPDPTALVLRVSASSIFSTGAATDDRARLLGALGLELKEIDHGFGVEFTVPTS